ncbi:MAG: hypothetical protein K0S07_979 [Chlamydiales bacterium]|jgi:hypothetical protein|nr:hypothetical protein [Chlamydiales bacterium]
MQVMNISGFPDSSGFTGLSLQLPELSISPSQSPREKAKKHKRYSTLPSLPAFFKKSESKIEPPKRDLSNMKASKSGSILYASSLEIKFRTPPAKNPDSPICTSQEVATKWTIAKKKNRSLSSQNIKGSFNQINAKGLLTLYNLKTAAASSQESQFVIDIGQGTYIHKWERERLRFSLEKNAPEKAVYLPFPESKGQKALHLNCLPNTRLSHQRLRALMASIHLAIEPALFLRLTAKALKSPELPAPNKVALLYAVSIWLDLNGPAACEVPAVKMAFKKVASLAQEDLSIGAYWQNALQEQMQAEWEKAPLGIPFSLLNDELPVGASPFFTRSEKESLKKAPLLAAKIHSMMVQMLKTIPLAEFFPPQCGQIQPSFNSFTQLFGAISYSARYEIAKIDLSAKGGKEAVRHSAYLVRLVQKKLLEMNNMCAAAALEGVFSDSAVLNQMSRAGKFKDRYIDLAKEAEQLLNPEKDYTKLKKHMAKKGGAFFPHLPMQRGHLNRLTSKECTEEASKDKALLEHNMLESGSIIDSLQQYRKGQPEQMIDRAIWSYLQHFATEDAYEERLAQLT